MGRSYLEVFLVTTVQDTTMKLFDRRTGDVGSLVWQLKHLQVWQGHRQLQMSVSKWLSTTYEMTRY